MIAKRLTIAISPITGFNSSRIICPSDLPPRRIDEKRITESCTPPPSVAPIRIQSVPGRYPNCAASTGPTNGPGPAIAAK